MTGSRGLLVFSLRSRRCLLPWIIVLVISATLAYAANSAATGRLAIGERQPDSELVRATGGEPIAPALESSSTLATSTDPDRSLAAENCAAGFIPDYVGVDSWIVAEDRRIACKHAAPGAAGE
jgi:hypothetical protein